MTRQLKINEYERLRILDDSILPEYKDFVKANYNFPRAIKTLMSFGSFEDELVGFNQFNLVSLQNSGLLKDSRLSTRQDLETALKVNARFFHNNYIDCGLALRPLEGVDFGCFQNTLLARNLSGQLKQRGIKIENGKLIRFSDLQLREYPLSLYGLVFDLKEDVKELEDLSKFKWDYTKDQGLSWAALGRGKTWDSERDQLCDSYSVFRVAIVEKINPLINQEKIKVPKYTLREKINKFFGGKK